MEITCMHTKAILALVFVCTMSFIPEAEAEPPSIPSDCTYEMMVWNVNQKITVIRKKVSHPYDELTAVEIDAKTKCTVCSEDQILVEVPPLEPFSVCYRIAPQVRQALLYLIQKGAPIHTVIGYHVIKSRGPLDDNGNRTGFSNHSFGTAIDINPEQNGLYENCITFGPQCKLLRGGDWRPGTSGTLERNSEIVTAFKQAGFLWGGEVAGKQKDFMHFSLTGY